MKYLNWKNGFLGLMLLFLSGCGKPQRNVALHDDFWKGQDQKIVVAQFKVNEPQLYTLGHQGLLDVAVTQLANNSLIKALKKTRLDWYQELPNKFVHRLQAEKFHATRYPKVLDHKSKDQLKHHLNILAETNGDMLLTMNIRAIGARREYSMGMIPKGGPEAYCVLVGSLVDATGKQLLWYHETEVIHKVQGPWDQPPQFPNFMAALDLAVSEAQEELLDSFFSGRSDNKDCKSKEGN